MSFPRGQSSAGEGISRIPGKTVFSSVKRGEAAQRPLSVEGKMLSFFSIPYEHVFLPLNRPGPGREHRGEKPGLHLSL